ncbi:MFS transporter [Streptomyces sp. HNM0663]|uniref:MFS transporter n=1 Tax=Streptomyces chengmaiensis TaxID=3040919 RepID=A0ABT6HGN1_9ACTN|nr:MFS transporter [Streptomyces chengmaiensis]MDH2387437.1 MFS transporter [Streptomyces chengmaiensis]
MASSDTSTTSGDAGDATQSTGAAHAGVKQVWREAPTAVKSLLVGTAVNRLGGFVQVFMVLYMTQRGFTAAQAGGALGVYGAGTVLGVLTGGWMSDRIGPRLTIMSTLVTSALLLPTVLYLDGYPAILAVIGVGGALSQAYRPASTSMISQLVPAERQVMIFAMVRLAINLGTTAAPLLGAALVQVSWDFLFWGESLAILVFAAVAAATLPRGHRSGEDPRADPADGPEGGAEGGADGGAASRDGAARARKASYLTVLADRRYLLFLLAMFASSMIYIQYVSTLPLAVRHLGMSTTVYAVLVALNGFLVITCELLVAKVVQRWPARIAVVAGVALTGVGMSLYALPLGLAALVIATLVWSLGEIVGYPTLFFAYPAQAGPPELRGRYLGASNSLYGLGTALGPFVGVMLWNRFGEGLWLGCGAVGLLAVAAAWFGVRPLEPAGSKGPADSTAKGPTEASAET